MNAYVKYALGAGALYLLWQAYVKARDAAAATASATPPASTPVGGKELPTPVPTPTQEQVYVTESGRKTDLSASNYKTTNPDFLQEA